MVSREHQLLNLRAIQTTFDAAMRSPNVRALAPRFVSRANQLLDEARQTADSDELRHEIARVQAAVDSQESQRSEQRRD